MKNMLIILALPILVGACEPKLSVVIKAIEQVESGGDCNAIGDNGLAVGCLQIHPIMVKDVNRILGHPKYAMKDRYNREKSYNMCKTYLTHYCTTKRLKHKPTAQDYSRCWNGGPNGFKKTSTLKYWAKVKALL